MILFQLVYTVQSVVFFFIGEILPQSLYFALFELPWYQLLCLVMSTEQPSKAAVSASRG